MAKVPISSGSYVAWEKPGQSVKGTLLSVDLTNGTAFDGSPCPELRIDGEDGELVVTCGQANLRRQVNRTNLPFLHVGGPITITYVRDEPLSNGKSYKSFEIDSDPAPEVETDGF